MVEEKATAVGNDSRKRSKLFVRASLLLSLGVGLVEVATKYDSLDHLVGSIGNWWQQRRLLSEPLAVEVKEGREIEAAWEQDPSTPPLPDSDIVTILRSGQPITELELYHSVGDQRLKDYPYNKFLAEGMAPTAVQSYVARLTARGDEFVILDVEDKIVGAHSDHLHSILIYDGTGKLVTKTPYPSESLVDKKYLTSNFSAFRTSGSMLDHVSNTSTPITFCNSFRLMKEGNNSLLRFSWVIDNGGYADRHLHQIEDYEFDGKNLKLMRSPAYAIVDSMDLPDRFQTIDDVPVMKRFLADVASPPISEILRQLREEDERHAKPARRKSATGAILPPTPGDRNR